MALRWQEGFPQIFHIKIHEGGTQMPLISFCPISSSAYETHLPSFFLRELFTGQRKSSGTRYGVEGGILCQGLGVQSVGEGLFGGRTQMRHKLAVVLEDIDASFIPFICVHFRSSDLVRSEAEQKQQS